jgi:hypothetical protein
MFVTAAWRQVHAKTPPPRHEGWGDHSIMHHAVALLPPVPPRPLKL